MALFPRPILTNGATHSAQQFRMLVRDLASGAEGVTEGDDLKVTQLSTPGAGVQVADGSGIVTGRADAFQGSYSVCNLGAATVDVAANGGGSTRYDMIVLRVYDPEYEGDLDPQTDDVAHFHVVSGVASNATTPPGGMTGIPLARIAIPASTATVTNAMITDLRKIANPRRERQLVTQSPGSMSTGLGGSTSWSYFSTAAGVNILVPAWATKAIVKVDVSPLRFDTGNFWGKMSATFGSLLATQDVLLDDDQGTGVRRIPGIIADTLTLPSSYRGTTQLLRVRAAGITGAQTARVYVDTGTSIAYDVQFEEGVL